MQFPELRKVVLGEPVSHELEPKVVRVEAELEREPIDFASLRSSLESLLAFLSSPEGRTHANCAVTDSFFMGVDGECDYSYLPDSFAEILGDIGGMLYSAVSSPETALSFESTPEQLLARVRAIDL